HRPRRALHLPVGRPAAGGGGGPLPHQDPPGGVRPGPRPDPGAAPVRGPRDPGVRRRRRQRRLPGVAGKIDAVSRHGRGRQLLRPVVFVYAFETILMRAITAIFLLSALGSLACANRGMKAPDDGGPGVAGTVGTAGRGGAGGTTGRGGGGGSARGG